MKQLVPNLDRPRYRYRDEMERRCWSLTRVWRAVRLSANKRLQLREKEAATESSDGMAIVAPALLVPSD